MPPPKPHATKILTIITLLSPSLGQGFSGLGDGKQHLGMHLAEKLLMCEIL